MKIHIKSPSQNLRFYFPTGMIFNKTTAKLANSFGRTFAAESLKDISPEALEILCTEIGKIKKKYGKWELVKVESASGETVEIIL